MENNKSVWSVLSKINCNDKTEKKNGLTYLSWSWAWGFVKSNFPDANYKVIHYDGKPFLFDEFLGYLVTTEVTINGETIPMNLPVMDGANKAMKAHPYTYKVKEYQNGKWTGKFIDKNVEAATMFDINTAIMRCLTKNLAMFGLGHYIYAGEDLPESDEEQEKVVPQKKQEQPKQEPKEDKPKVDKWMTEKQFEEIKQKTKAEIKKYLGIYNGTTPYTDGHIYGMKKQYKEELEKLV